MREGRRLVSRRLVQQGQWQRAVGLAALDAGDGHLLDLDVKLTSHSNYDPPAVDALALESGYLYAAGSFDEVNGVACSNLADIAPDGTAAG